MKSKVENLNTKTKHITDIKNALIGGFVILFYLLASSSPLLILTLIGINYKHLPFILYYAYLISYEIILALIIIYIYEKDIIPNFYDFKENFKKYFKKYFKYWILMLILMMASNFIITSYTSNNTSNNQETINAVFKIAPVYAFIVTIITAPILEELVFRLSFRKLFPYSNILYILISGFIFGIMHVLGTATDMKEFLFIIPYSIPGIMFAYIYSKTNNICVTIGLHFMHNFLMLLLKII